MDIRKKQYFRFGVVFAVVITLVVLGYATTCFLAVDQEEAAQEYTDPLANIDDIVRDFQKGLEQGEESRLAMFELELRESLKAGWKPPWSELEVSLSANKIASLTTEELGKACFVSGLSARTLLLYENPNFGIKRLEILHRGYAELFRRPDSWKGLIAAIELYTSKLDPQGKGIDNVNSIMGLSTLPELYGYPSLRKRIVGHEKEMISAHIGALEKISVYLDSQPSPDQLAASKLFFSATAPVSLVRSALALSKSVSPQKYEAARSALSQFRWGKNYTACDVKQFVDKAVKELKCTINNVETNGSNKE